jgi:hypothetical protein
MTIEFLFETYSQLEASIILAGIAASVFLLAWGLSLRKQDALEHTNLLAIIGFFLLLWSILRYILPDISVSDWTWGELQFGFAFDFTRERSVRKALEIVLGIALLMHGKDNRSPFWFSLSIGGLFLSVYQVLSAFNYGILYYLLWFYSAAGVEYQGSLFVPFELMNYGLLFVSMGFILLFAFRNLILSFSDSRQLKTLASQIFLIVYSVLYLAPILLFGGIPPDGILPGMSISLVIGIGLFLYFMRRGSNSQPVAKEVNE